MPLSSTFEDSTNPSRPRPASRLDRWDTAVRELAGRGGAPLGPFPTAAKVKSSGAAAFGPSWMTPTDGIRRLSVIERVSYYGVPSFGEDEDKFWDAGTLNILLLGFTAFLAMMLIGTFTVFERPLEASIVIAIFAAHVFAVRAMMRTGRVYLASAVFVGGTWVIFAAYVAAAGGIHTSAPFVFSFVCVIAGLLLGQRAALTTLTLSGLVVLVLSVSSWGGRELPQVFRSGDIPRIAFFGGLLLLFVALLVLHTFRHKITVAREQEQHYRRLIEQSIDGILITDREGHALLANSALSAMFGYSEQDLTTLSILDTYVDADRELGRERMRRVAAGERLRFERPMRRRDGTELIVEVTATRLNDGRRQLVYRDISERVHAELAHRESEDRYRRLSSAAFEGISMTENGVIIDANERLAVMLGYPLEELIGVHVLTLVAPEDRDLVRDVMSSGSHEPYEHTGLRKDGSRFPVEVQARSLKLPDRTLRVAAVRDISDRLRAQQALLRSEEKYREVFNGVRDVIFAISPSGTITSLNTAFEESTGWRCTDYIGKSFLDLLHPDDSAAALDLIRSSLEDMPRGSAQFRVKHRDGSYVVGECRTSTQYKDGYAIGILGIVRDITRRLQLEDQLRQAQKMEAVGQLAGGVAHDFNNLLTAIVGHSQLLLSDLPPDDVRRDDVEQIGLAAERASVLVRQLLTFSRRQVLQPKVISLMKTIAGSEKLLRRLLNADVTLLTRWDADLGNVRADAGQIEQVIVNLAVNARDAMPHGGTLRIEAANVDVAAEEGEDLQSVGSIPPGSYVQLSVSDTGTGMTDAIRAHIFEPFFTTKPEGRGTGIGLSTVHGIVRQTDGFITIDSAVGSGTTFTVYLPRVSEDIETTDPRTLATPSPRGTEVILLVEDEVGVRTVASRVLKKQGYTVLEAADGYAALHIAGAMTDSIALLITDIVMPRLGGPALAEQLARSHPEMKVLYMSGYADDAVVKHGVLDATVNFLQKPFRVETLAQKVRRILDVMVTV